MYIYIYIYLSHCYPIDLQCVTVPQELVALNAPKRLTEALRAGWLEGRAEMAHWYAMLLANVSTSKKGQERGGFQGINS